MARPLRLEFSGAIYHLTSRGNARQRIFFTDADRELFLTTLGGVVRRYHWICHAYCLMANHYHLLVETPKANLWIGMRQLNGIYTQSFNRRRNRIGHLFQGRFKAILVGKGLSFAGALPLYRAQSRTDQRRGESARLEMEQQPGHSGLDCGAGVFEHRVNYRANRHETFAGTKAVPAVCQGWLGEQALGRSQGTDLLWEAKPLSKSTRRRRKIFGKSRGRNGVLPSRRSRGYLQTATRKR